MGIPLTADKPDQEEIILQIFDEQVTLRQFVSYSFSSDFLTPSDGWTFTLADGDLPARQLAALKLGARVGLIVNTARVSDGQIDAVEMSADPHGGVHYTIHGRDRLGLAVDAIADPTLQFKEGTRLDDMLVALFSPFGWVNKDEHYAIDNSANRAVSTGGDRGIKTSKSGSKKVKPLKDFVLHQMKPHNHEGTFDFAKRISERFGLWIWSSCDGDVLIVGQPDFNQEPLYQLRRTRDGKGNIESGSVRYDVTDQPSIVFADGFGGGGEYGKSRIKAYAVNPYFGVDENGFVLDDLLPLIAKQKDAQQVALVTQPFTRRATNIPIRPMYLHDDESKTQEQLEKFVRREMSLLMRKSLTVEYTVEGHGQYDADGQFTAWAVDTVVTVKDDIGLLDENMWVLGVTFEKSRRGTFTKLHLIRLNSIQF
jgi:prophage tail gpP-like protein